MWVIQKHCLQRADYLVVLYVKSLAALPVSKLAVFGV